MDNPSAPNPSVLSRGHSGRTPNAELLRFRLALRGFVLAAAVGAAGATLRHHLDRAVHAEKAVKEVGAFDTVRARCARHHPDFNHLVGRDSHVTVGWRQ